MNSNDLSSLMADDATQLPLVVNDTKLREVAALAQRIDELDAEIDAATAMVESLTKERNRLSLFVVPDLFDEMGLSALKLSDGSEVTIKRKFSGSIKTEDVEAAYKWLDENGHAIVKSEVIIRLDRGEPQQKEFVSKVLGKLNVEYEIKESVHSQTLNAFVKECTENGTDLCPEISVFPVRVTKITKPKGRKV